MISAMARDEDAELIRAAYDYNLALVSNGSLTEESFKQCRTHVNDGFADLVNSMRPWAKTTKEDRSKAQSTAMMDMYKKYVGDPNDPEFQKKIAVEVARLSERVKAPVDRTTLLAGRMAEIRKEREKAGPQVVLFK